MWLVLVAVLEAWHLAGRTCGWTSTSGKTSQGVEQAARQRGGRVVLDVGCLSGGALASDGPVASSTNKASTTSYGASTLTAGP